MGRGSSPTEGNFIWGSLGAAGGTSPTAPLPSSPDPTLNSLFLQPLFLIHLSCRLIYPAL